MRYRKSIKLLPGLKVNVSKSGLSLSAGVRGASVTLGPKGTYVNTGIPGTGLYQRKKIGGGQIDTRARGAEYVEMKISVSLDSDGKPVIKDSSDRIVTDESLLRKIKRTPQYKETVEKLSREKANEVNQEIAKFINIYQITPSIITKKQIEEELKDLRYVEYKKKEFSEVAPTIETIRMDLEAKAKMEIRSILFWTNKRKRKEFVESNLSTTHDLSSIQWQKRKADLELQESAYKTEQDEKRRKEYEEAKDTFESQLAGKENYVNNTLETMLSETSLPVEFSLDYQYEESGALYIDLDLPEIEDLPTEKANILASGKVSIKQKTQKEQKQDYGQCVAGLGFFFAGCFFNISPKIEKILISGYTQRLSKQTGNIEDQYVYSTLFDRDTFGKLNVSQIDPIEAMNNFKNRIDITKTFELKTIEPLNEKDV